MCSEQPQNPLQGCSPRATFWASCSKMEQLWKLLWMIFKLTPAVPSFSATWPARSSLPVPWRSLLWFQLKNKPEVMVMLRFSFASRGTLSVIILQPASKVLLFQWQLAGLSKATLISSLTAQLCLYPPLFGCDPSQVSTAVTCNPYQNFFGSFQCLLEAGAFVSRCSSHFPFRSPAVPTPPPCTQLCFHFLFLCEKVLSGAGHFS